MILVKPAERLNTKAVIRLVSERMGCYKKDAAELLEHFSNIVAETLAQGGTVDFRPLGVFKIGRKGVVKFKPAAKIIRRVKEARRDEAEQAGN